MESRRDKRRFTFKSGYGWVVAVALAAAVGGAQPSIARRPAVDLSPTLLSRVVAAFAAGAPTASFDAIAGLRWTTTTSYPNGRWERSADIQMNRGSDDSSVTLSGPNGKEADRVSIAESVAPATYRATLTRQFGAGASVRDIAGRCAAAADGQGSDSESTGFLRIDFPGREPLWVIATHDVWPINPTGNNLYQISRVDPATIIQRMKCRYAKGAVSAG